MFSSTRLHAFVCIALGIAVNAAPAAAPAAKVDARSPDVYDLGGGIAGLILGLEGERTGANGDEDAYILKRQLAGLDIGSRLGSNTGLAHATDLGGGALNRNQAGAVEARSPDVYDLGGGLTGLLLGLDGGNYGADDDDDVYILKRQLAGLDISSTLGANAGLAHAATLGEGALNLGNGHRRDVYDLGGGLVGLVLGLQGERGGADGDEDTYILKRQLAGLDIDSKLGSNIGLAHAAGLGEGALELGEGKRDVYDLGGGITGLLLGLGGENYGGDGDKDTYILKRQLAGLDIGSRLGSNAGLAHAAELGAGAVDHSSESKRDVYDLGGGLTALLLGLNGESYGGDSDEDVYVLKRQLAGLDIGSRLGSNMSLMHATSLGESTLGSLEQ